MHFQKKDIRSAMKKTKHITPFNNLHCCIADPYTARERCGIKQRGVLLSAWVDVSPVKDKQISGTLLPRE